MTKKHKKPPRKAREEQRFHFEQHDTLGAEDARHDQRFLEECFVYTTHYNVLRDTTSTRSIVVGRTGAGKSALLIKLKDDVEMGFEIRPESLSLNYITNSTIIKFLQQNGVRLDNFFKLLWRHVFAVEVIKNKFNLSTEAGQKSWLFKLENQFRSKKHRNAIEYFVQRGGTFWKDTDFRVREIVTNFENEVSAQVGMSVPQLNAKLKAADKVSEQEKVDVTYRGQTIIDMVHMRELSDIIDTVDHILDDPQRPYYLIIDRLDEGWVEEGLRYLLIRALIETVRDFVDVRNLKIVVAIRHDLLERVFTLTRDPGFQEEKYRSLYLDLSWTPGQLTDIIDRRLNQLVKFRYGKSELTHRDVLPTLKGQRHKPAMEYMIDRTLMRPRDIIVFFNYCVAEAIDREHITLQNFKAAEGSYSEDRLKSLQYEWQSDYPHLTHFITNIFTKSPYRFTVDEIDAIRAQDAALDAVIKEYPRGDDPLVSASYSLVAELITVKDFKQFIAFALYSAGFLGMKRTTAESFKYVSSSGARSMSKNDVTPRTHCEVHPCFWRALGIADAYSDLEPRRRSSDRLSRD